MERAHGPIKFPVVMPRTQREARVFNYGRSEELREQFWPIDFWPTYIQLLWLKAHLTYKDRWTLYRFFVLNGLDPALAGSWTLLTDVARDPVNGGYTLISQNYDRAAWEHIASMQSISLEEHRAPESGNFVYWDISEGRSVQ